MISNHYVLDPFICKGQQAFESINQSIYSQDDPKRTSAGMELRQELGTQNLNIYLYNYQTETAIFLATKYEKTVMYGVQLFNFFFNISFILNFWPANESIHLNSWDHNHKKQKDCLETQVLFVDILACT